MQSPLVKCSRIRYVVAGSLGLRLAPALALYGDFGLDNDVAARDMLKQMEGIRSGEMAPPELPFEAGDPDQLLGGWRRKNAGG